jgi:SnoaL-like domain
VTDTITSRPAADVVRDYFAMWNELDPQRRLAAIEAAWAPEGSYEDPMFNAQGAPALEALASGVHSKYPGHTFRQTTTVDTHHSVARWDWAFVAPDGQTSVMEGVDFATFAPDGRLQSVTGFFNPR